MKVLMFGWELPPHNSGGLGVACEGMATALAQQGVEVTFVLPRAVPDLHEPFPIRFASGGSITMAALNSPLTAYMTAAQYEALSPDEKARFGKTLYAEVLRFGIAAGAISRSEPFDLIHAHDWLTFPAGIIAKQETHKPLVVHAHLTGYEQSGGYVDPNVAAIERAGFAAADRVIAVSNLTRKILIEKYNVPEEKIIVVHNGITILPEMEELPARVERLIGDKRVVLFVGRLTLHKGPDYFIRAAQLALKKRQDVLFIIAGSGEMERQMVRLAAELGIGDSVLFAGFLRGPALAELYRRASLYVMSSVYDPFGLTALEALSYHTPAIVSKQAGVGEVLRHILRVDFWDTREMANKILAVLDHDPLRQTLAKNGFQEVRQMPWTRAADELQKIYSSLLPAPISV